MGAEDKILILSANEETRETLLSIAGELYGSVSVGSDSSAAAKFVKTAETPYSAVIIAAPLEDGYGLDAAAQILKNSNASVIVITSAKNAEEASNKIGRLGAYILPKPLNKPALVQALRFMAANRSRMLALEKEKQELADKIREIKLVDRAKCVLIQYLRISEAEAHRQIQKQAMDQRTALVQVAADILKTYEYL